jgi:PmbA protein
MNNKERLALAEWAMNLTLQKGASEASVVILRQQPVKIEFRDQKLETLKQSLQNSLSLQIYADHRYSENSTNDLRKGSLEKFIEDVVTSTKYLAQDEYRSLPNPQYYPENTNIDLKIKDEQYESLTLSERVKMAAEIEEIAMAQSSHIISTTAWCSDVHSLIARIHSNGFSGDFEGTRFSAGAEVTVKDKDGCRPEDWYAANTRFHKGLPSAEMLGKNAAQRALRKMGQKKIASGRYNMLVENRVGNRLISLLTRPMNGQALQQKSSFLEGMQGQKIASEKLTLIDDPLLKTGMGSRLFDGEGLAAQRRTMIDKGVLQYYYIDHYYGKKLGMEPTTGSSSNFVFEYGTRKLEEMRKDIRDGILITGFIGGNSNPTTGDFSFGIMGSLIENGEFTKPIYEMNISGNAKEFWNQLVEVGNDPYPYASCQSPSLFFEKINFSGV